MNTDKRREIDSKIMHIKELMRELARYDEVKEMELTIDYAAGAGNNVACYHFVNSVPESMRGASAGSHRD